MGNDVLYLRQKDGKNMRFIGITGGVGAGKSEVLGYIRKHYVCEVWLADEVAHLVKRRGTLCFERLVKLLGQEIVGIDGEINKAVMAEKIFTDEALLDEVNAIVHPAVMDFLVTEIERARAEGKVELFFVEAALLIEAGYLDLVDEMWYVYADEHTRRQRLKASRGYSEEKISNIMAQQLTEETFREKCDFVIDNSASFEESCRQIDKKLEAFTWLE